MSDIFVLIRDQDNIALTSIGGVPFIAQLKKSKQILVEEMVDLIYADAGFDDLPVGEYTVVVQHAQVEPGEAVYEVMLDAEDEVVLLKFVYLKPEHILLQIQDTREKRL